MAINLDRLLAELRDREMLGNENPIEMGPDAFLNWYKDLATIIDTGYYRVDFLNGVLMDGGFVTAQGRNEFYDEFLHVG